MELDVTGFIARLNQYFDLVDENSVLPEILSADDISELHSLVYNCSSKELLPPHGCAG